MPVRRLFHLIPQPISDTITFHTLFIHFFILSVFGLFIKLDIVISPVIPQTIPFEPEHACMGSGITSLLNCAFITGKVQAITNALSP
jgi:hypothetical protein